MSSDPQRQLPVPIHASASPQGHSQAFAMARESNLFDVRKWMSIFHRRFWLFTFTALIVLTGVVIFTATQTPVFTATSSVMLHIPREQVTNIPEVLQNGPPSDRNASITDTEAQMLKTGPLSRRVVDALHLNQDPEFNPNLAIPSPTSKFIQSIAQKFGAPAPGPKPGPEVFNPDTVENVRSQLTATRIGTTYIVEINFISRDPAKATRIANAFADQYLAEQQDAKIRATRQATTWLGGRLAELKGQVQTAEAAVAQYKIANNLMSASGQTLTEQDVSNYNQQAAQARAALGEAEGRLRAARQQMARGSSGEDLGESLKSVVIQNLRTQRGLVSARVADLSGRYGPKHPDLLRAQSELADIDRQIQSEVTRIVSSLESDVAASRQRVAAIQQSVAAGQGALANNNRSSTQLQELQRNADAVRSLYESFLARYKETSSQEGIATPNARIVTYADLPTAPSAPVLKINLIVGMALALAAGLTALLIAEMLDSSFSTADDVQRRLMMPYLGGIPELASIPRGDRSPTHHVVGSPMSAFSEAFRSLGTSLLYSHPDGPAQVVAISSALPGEGKTVASVCLARSLGLQGHRVILVDCDLRGGAAWTVGGTRPRYGLLEVLSGQAPLSAAIIRDSETGADVLPLKTVTKTSKDVFGSGAMDQLLETLRNQYELVILDTGPVLAVAETRILASKSDAVMMLAAWRKTPQKAIESALEMLDGVGAQVLGLVLTQIDMRRQVKTGYGDPSFYYPKYKKYYLG
jgi:succinoglycan biosynthesis transport protein ExoP